MSKNKLEDLPNEIILQIFPFLELTQLHRAFSSLNSRLECLLYDDYTLLYARLISSSSLTLPLFKFCFRIKNLSLINWLPNDVLCLTEPLTLPQLKCLNIESSNNLYFGQPSNDLIHRILSFPNLCKCQIKLSPTLYILNIQLPFSRTIEHLSLSMITLDMLFDLLIRVPKLRSLTVWLNSTGRVFDNKTYDQHYCCLNLQTFNIGLHNDIKFEEILFLLPRMPILHSLKIYGSVWDQEFLNQRHWENILSGENLFPLLNQIQVNLYIRCSANITNADFLYSQFNDEIFRRTHFSVTFDQMYWLYLKCLWHN
jgi:hypothetical protein